ncbi:hypothetical protein B0A53_03287 [Rhodotorula sp. CCFEE 5036]|nr:hypothetical protein B0A53_03287 [Rhodotorula sp. CCFEE 5036]
MAPSAGSSAGEENGQRSRENSATESLDAETADVESPLPASGLARAGSSGSRQHAQADQGPSYSRTYPFARTMSTAPHGGNAKPTSPAAAGASPRSRPSLAAHSRPSFIAMPPRHSGSDPAAFASPDVTSPSGRLSVSSAGSSAGSRVTAPDLAGSSARYFPIRSVMYPSTSSTGSRGSRSGSTAAFSSGSGAPPESAEALLATEGFPMSPREQDELDFANANASVPAREGDSDKWLTDHNRHNATRPHVRPLPDRRGSSSRTEGGGRSETSGYSSSFGTEPGSKPASLDPYLSEPTTHAKIGDPDSDDEVEEDNQGAQGMHGEQQSKDRHREHRSDVQEHDFGGESARSAGHEGDRRTRTDQSRQLNPNESRYERDGEHIVLTGREGELQRCEDEPIHAPGAIQAFGVLIAFDLRDDDTMVVQQVSENSGFVIGIHPRALFRAKCFSELLSEDETDVLLDAIDALDERDADETNEEVGPYTFILSGQGEPGSGTTDAHARDRLQWSCHAAIHRPNPTQQPERLILELELVDDQVNPLQTRSQEPLTPDERGGLGNPEDYGENGINPTEEELIESTVSIIKPLRQLTRNRNARSSRRRGRGARRTDDDVDVVGLLSQINDQLSKADDLDVFLKIVAGIFRELTEFDRVMVYQFDEEWNGRVVAEQVDWSRTKDLFRGLSFPASDIPAQARELYRINKVRVLYDRDQPTARLCCRSMDEVNVPLDMTHCHLRAMSPIHIKYLGNMGVRASTSISITAFGDLWGLVSMHGYGRYGHRVSFRVRQICKLLGQSVSRNIERISYASRLQARKLINTAGSEQNPSGYIVAKAEDLLDLFHADFGVLSIGDEAKILGAIANSQELLALLEYLRMRNFRTLVTSQDIRKDFSDIDYPDGFKFVAGILVVPLSASGNDFIVFCRKGQLQEIHWAGNPNANKVAGGGDYRPLEPRKSFKVWSETVVGKSRAWTDEEKETASVLCLVYGKFIAVWREKESALAASQLTNLLLQNASHEVRTPLNAIINYLELALDGPIQGEVRDNLVRSHAASKSLIHVINDLLDLTRTEKGNDLFLTDPFDIAETLEEAVSTHRVEAKRRGLSLDVVETPSGTPPTVLGDRAKIRQIVTNVVANALKHTDEGGILIEWGEMIDENLRDALDAKQDGIRIGISVSDTGHGITEQKLENIFRQLENVSTVGDRERDASADTEQAVGLGLAVVARIVRNLGGQLQVESKVGKGSKFTFIFPFRLPPDSSGSPASTPSLASSLEGTAFFGNGGSSGQKRLTQSPANRGNQSRRTSLSTVSAGESPTSGNATTPRPASPEQRGPVPAANSSQSPDRPRPAKATAAEDAIDPLRVLVVEDEMVNRMIISQRLKKDGHEVVVAEHGGAAVRKFEEDRNFDVVLMDLQMPIMNGIDASRNIRRVEGERPIAENEKRPSARLNRGIPILAVTASLPERDRQTIVDARLDGWLLKPIDFKRLRTLLRGATDQEARRHELYRPGQWERGGWLSDVSPRDGDVAADSTAK